MKHRLFGIVTLILAVALMLTAPINARAGLLSDMADEIRQDVNGSIQREADSATAPMEAGTAAESEVETGALADVSAASGETKQSGADSQTTQADTAAAEPSDQDDAALEEMPVVQDEPIKGAQAQPLADVPDVQSEDVTKRCQVKVSTGGTKKLLDGNIRTAWEYDDPGEWIAAKFPDDVTPGYLAVEWLFEPLGFDIVEYDDAMQPIRTRDQSCSFPGIESVYELLPTARYVQLRMTAPDQQVCSIHLFSQGILPKSVHNWQAPVKKADLMVVSTHQDDELIFFGGTIPYYNVQEQRPTIVVYMANCTRLRRGEALNGLWSMGVRTYPDFINLKDKRTASIDESVRLWGGKDKILSEVVARIRRYKPEVIVTHDFDGEYGHNQHKTTARAVVLAMQAAADPEQFPESYRLYGAWQVKKLYIHLYGENVIQMDWKQPLDAYDGHTALEAARYGYSKHVSQQKWYQVEDGGKYDNARFGLYFTTVGLDTGKRDMFENIGQDLSATVADAASGSLIADGAGGGEQLPAGGN